MAEEKVPVPPRFLPPASIPHSSNRQDAWLWTRKSRFESSVGSVLNLFKGDALDTPEPVSKGPAVPIDHLTPDQLSRLNSRLKLSLEQRNQRIGAFNNRI